MSLLRKLLVMIVEAFTSRFDVSFKKKQNAELSHILADLNIESSGDTEYTDDLLALMDSVK